jgi:hypothetical protein
MSSTDEIFDIDLNQLESFRIKQKKIYDRNNGNRSFILLFTIIFGAIYFYSFLNLWNTIIALFIVVLIVFSILEKIFIKPYVTKFNDFFKINAIDRIHNSLGYNLIFNVNTRFEKEELKQSNFLPYFNYFVPEYLFTGIIEDVGIRFSKVIAGYSSRMNTNIYLNGFYLILNYKLDSAINIEVVKKRLNRPTIRKLYLKNSNEYKTNKVDFEKTYIVYYNKSFKINELITESIISNLLSLNQKIGTEVCFTIKNGNVYIAFDDTRKYFNIDINKTSIELTKEYQNNVENIYATILELKKFIDTVILTFS